MELLQIYAGFHLGTYSGNVNFMGEIPEITKS